MNSGGDFRRKEGREMRSTASSQRAIMSSCVSCSTRRIISSHDLTAIRLLSYIGQATNFVHVYLCVEASAT